MDVAVLRLLKFVDWALRLITYELSPWEALKLGLKSLIIFQQIVICLQFFRKAKNIVSFIKLPSINQQTSLHKNLKIVVALIL